MTAGSTSWPAPRMRRSTLSGTGTGAGFWPRSRSNVLVPRPAQGPRSRARRSGRVKGLRIGAAPGPVDGLKRMLVESGIDPEREVEIGPVPRSAGAGVSFGVAAAKALEEGKLDGFWANGMGAEVAVRSGIGTLVLDARRGDGPASARDYTFAAFVTTQKTIERQPAIVAGAVRALVGAQQTLKREPGRAAQAAKRLFPETEAGLIAELVGRDAPYYDAAISTQSVDALNRFARDLGILTGGRPTIKWSQPDSGTSGILRRPLELLFTSVTVSGQRRCTGFFAPGAEPPQLSPQTGNQSPGAQAMRPGCKNYFPCMPSIVTSGSPSPSRS